jgi:hypothetical protein
MTPTKSPLEILVCRVEELGEERKRPHSVNRSEMIQEDLACVAVELAQAVRVLSEALEHYASGRHVYYPSNEPGMRPGKIGYDDPDEIEDRGEIATEALQRANYLAKGKE